jgi:endonuclease/exonuclease/phosphatase (EEP) superfamily protein YafD
MLITLGIATFLLVAVTLLPLWHNPHWLVRGWEFPRVQIAAVATALLLLHLSQLNLRSAPAWTLIAATVLCLLWQLWWIIPYTRLWRVEVLQAREAPANPRIRILSVNVLMTNRNAQGLMALVEQHQPDILVTLESDQWWQDQLDRLGTKFPHTIKCPLSNLYGMHVYSRLPLRDSTITYLVEDDKPSMHSLVTLDGGHDVRMHFVHPAPPSPTENPESVERDAELVMVARSVATSLHPVIVAGDFNDVAWSPTTRLFRKLSGLLDPRIGRGMFNTFNAKYPFLRWPLDHIFHSGHFTLVRIGRLAKIGSDHFPLLTELMFTPSKEAEQDGPPTDAADLERASEIEAKAGTRKGVPTPGEG